MPNQVLSTVLQILLPQAFLLLPVYAQNRALLLPGDTVAGVGTIVAVGEFSMNSSGSWVAVVSVEGGAGIQTALIRDGQPYVIPAALQHTPVFSTNEKFLDIDEAGNIAWLGNPSASTGWTIFVNNKPVLQSGTFLDLDGNGLVENVASVRNLILADDGSEAVYCTLGYQLSPLYDIAWIRRTTTGALQTKHVGGKGVPMPGGQTMPGLTSGSAPTMRYEFDSNASGDLLFGIVNLGVLRYSVANENLQVIAYVGGPSPFFGKVWGFSIFNGKALTDGQGAYFPGYVGDSSGGINVLARNEQIVLTELHPFASPVEEVVTIGGSAPVRVTESEATLWMTAFYDEQGQLREGLFRNEELSIMSGGTKVAGQLIDSFSVGGLGFDFDSAGEVILSRARLANGQAGLFEFRPAAKVASLSGCIAKTALLTKESVV